MDRGPFPHVAAPPFLEWEVLAILGAMASLTPLSTLDRLGIASSLLCLAHCLVFPVLALFSSVALLSAPMFHDLFVMTSLASFLALFAPWRAGMISSKAFTLACLGAILLLLGMRFEAIETPGTVVGAVILFFVHLMSLRAHARKHRKETSCCECP